MWKPFFHIFTLGDVINAQTWELSPQKIPVEPPEDEIDECMNFIYYKPDRCEIYVTL